MVSKPNKSRTHLETQVGFQTWTASGSYSKDADQLWTALSEKVESYGHPIPKNGKNWSGDIGGPFYHERTEVTSVPHVVNVRHPGPNPLLKGGRVSGKHHLRAPAGLQSLTLNTSISEPSDFFMDGKGTTAIKITEPTQPLVSLANTLGELRRDGIPGAPGIATLRQRTLRAKNAGNEYLNVEFGWRPLVSDLHKLARAVIDSHDEIEKYEKLSQKLIRRHFEFPIESTTTVDKAYQVNVGPSGPKILAASTWGSPKGTVMRSTTSYTKTWFDGAFRFHLPLGSDTKSRMIRHTRQAQHLLGIFPTPDVIWNLTPWSWLADWFANTGDILSNVRAFAFDGLVMQYGYVMCETKIEDRYVLDYGTYIDGSSGSCSATVTKLIQKRRQATPFGFGLVWSSFSPHQLAILAALGITQGGGVAK